MPERNTKPAITIVIPAYNHESYVRDAIESILHQTFDDWELIIIDDGSTDSTVTVVDEYFGISKVQVHHQENQGLSATLNRGLALARGKYFGFLPSDDLFYPEKLDIQVGWLEARPDVAALATHQTLMDANGRPLENLHVKEWFNVIPKNRTSFILDLFERNFVSAPSVLLRTGVLRDLGGFDLQCIYMQDYDLWLRILKSYEMAILPKALVHYRWHGRNLTYEATLATEAERARVLKKAAEAFEPEELFPALREDLRPEIIAGYRAKLHEIIYRSNPPNRAEIQAIFDQKFRRIWDNRIKPQQKRLPSLCSKFAQVNVNSFMNVLLEVSILDRGGLEQMTRNVALGLAKHGHRVVVVCVEKGGYIAERLAHTGKIIVEVLPQQDKSDAYKEILRRYQIDVVNSHYSTFGTRLAADASIPVITVIHNIYAWLPDDILSDFRTVDPLVSHYVAVSEDAANFLAKRLKVDHKRIRIIPNGLDLEQWEGCSNTVSVRREDLGLNSQDYVFLTVASIYRVKGQDRIVRIFPELLRTCPKARAVFLGNVVDPTYHRYLEHLIEQLDLRDKVVIVPYTPEPAPYYSLADAFVLPSVIEGWSLSMMEAMYFGLPILMTDVAGVKTIMKDHTLGILIPPPYESADDLDASFCDLYTMMPEDPTLPHLLKAMQEFCSFPSKWKKNGSQGTDIVRNEFNLDKTVTAYEKLLLAVTSNYRQQLIEAYGERCKNLSQALESSQEMIARLSDNGRLSWQLGDIQARLNEVSGKMFSEQMQTDKLDRELDGVKRKLTESEKCNSLLSGEMRRLRRELTTIYSSKGWKALMLYRCMLGGIVGLLRSKKN
jgi:glycosyltransferase involved in cell wall biosynthesis/GT2 family glycosyltransferase